MQRYFALNRLDDIFTFNDVDSHHMMKVMRVKLNEQIEVVFDKHLYLGSICSLNPLQVKLVKELNDDSELRNNVTLYYCLVKGDKLDLVIQKAVELGVNRIVLLNCKRSIVKIKKEDVNKKLDRYQQIVKSASEQSHRLLIPSVEGIYDLNKLDVSKLCNHNFIAYELEKGVVDKTREYYQNINENESVGILVGPEGGFEQSEVDYCNSIGFKTISLGKRILRSETAAIASLAQLAFILENKR